MMPPALEEDFMQRSRTPSQLSESLHKRLNAYALAASAAGVGVLALAQPAVAKIVYTPIYIRIAPHTAYELDLINHDGGDFSFSNTTRISSRRSSLGFGTFTVAPQGENAVEGYASVLRRGAQIGPSAKFESASQLMLKMERSCNHTTMGGSSCHEGIIGGKWKSVKDGYLGLKVFIRGKVHYGWARFSVGWGKYGIRPLLSGYAYETIPNKPIISGKTKGPYDMSLEGPDPAVTNPIPDIPQPASLGALAMGTPGLSIWRRQESAGAAQ
jgi:hypothetical protein